MRLGQKCSSHLIRLPVSAAKSLVIPQVGESTNVKFILNFQVRVIRSRYASFTLNIVMVARIAGHARQKTH